MPLTSAQQAPWQAASSMEKRLILLQNKLKYHREFFCQHFTIFRHSFHSNLSKYEHVGGQYPFFLRVLCGSRVKAYSFLTWQVKNLRLCSVKLSYLHMFSQIKSLISVTQGKEHIQTIRFVIFPTLVVW